MNLLLPLLSLAAATGSDMVAPPVRKLHHIVARIWLPKKVLEPIGEDQIRELGISSYFRSGGKTTEMLCKAALEGDELAAEKCREITVSNLLSDFNAREYVAFSGSEWGSSIEEAISSLLRRHPKTRAHHVLFDHLSPDEFDSPYDLVDLISATKGGRVVAIDYEPVGARAFTTPPREEMIEILGATEHWLLSLDEIVEFQGLTLAEVLKETEHRKAMRDTPSLIIRGGTIDL